MVRATRPAVPFVPFGRDYHGWDCFGLVVCAYRDVLGVTLPDYAYQSTRDPRALARLFADRSAPHYRVSDPAPMAVACVYRRGLPIHVGLVVSKKRILHVEEGVMTCVEPITRFRIEGFYVPADCRSAPVQS